MESIIAFILQLLAAQVGKICSIGRIQLFRVWIPRLDNTVEKELLRRGQHGLYEVTHGSCSSRDATLYIPRGRRVSVCESWINARLCHSKLSLQEQAGSFLESANETIQPLGFKYTCK